MSKITVPACQTIGAYQVVEKIGRGAMGVVYKARHRDTGELVAIKLSSATINEHPVLAQRSRREYGATRLLNHPRLLRSLDHGMMNSSPYIVMELAEGLNLAQRLKRGGKLAEADAVHIIIQIADALHYVHKHGVIHRDIKPSNIVLADNNDAKLIDFGLAKNTKVDVTLTPARLGLGTPNFMAPEQFEDASNVDRRADVYSLAATLYMAVTGKVPFESPSTIGILKKKLTDDIPPAVQLAPELSKRIDFAIRMALRPEPNHRPSSCLEFFSMLTGKNSFPPLTPDIQGNKVLAGERTRERRATTRFPCNPEAGCYVGFDAEVKWAAKIVNVSPIGIGLILPRRFELGAQLQLFWKGQQDGTPTLFGGVRRVQAVAAQGWLLDCTFHRVLTNNELQSLR